jgi:uncharacterized protein YndB with AHSA1/START domain
VVPERRQAAFAGRGRGAADIEELTTNRIDIEQRIAAPATTVFSYLTDPRKFVSWMGRSAEIDPRPGGVFRLDVDGEHVASGRYEVVEPPSRIVLTWGWEGSGDVPPGSTMVEITLQADGAATVLRLRHTGLPTEQERASHANGWVLYVGRLAAVLAETPPA